MRELLQKIANSRAVPMFDRDFGVPAEDEQQLRNDLYELEQRGFITAQVISSRMRETFGLPLDVGEIKLSKEGWAFLEGKPESQTGSVSTVFNINTNGNSTPAFSFSNVGNLNNITNADADKMLQSILSAIAQSNLPEKEQNGLSSSVTALFKAAAPNVVASLLIGAVQAMVA
ncbi:hypothetical protein [Desulfofustis glycolicus]|nr:hypothetical protein [Desulfofustis glycolicus]